MKKRKLLKKSRRAVPKHNEEARERGHLLSAMLIAFFIFFINNLYQLTHGNGLSEIYVNIPTWFPIYTAATAGIGILALLGIWFWKRWGAYLLILVWGSSILLHIFFLNLGKIQEFAFYATIVASLSWYIALIRKWSQFS